jgi:hypothetical protein
MISSSGAEWGEKAAHDPRGDAKPDRDHVREPGVRNEDSHAEYRAAG